MRRFLWYLPLCLLAGCITAPEATPDAESSVEASVKPKPEAEKRDQGKRNVDPVRKPLDNEGMETPGAHRPDGFPRRKPEPL